MSSQSQWAYTRNKNQVFCQDCKSNRNFNQVANSSTNKEVNVSNVILSFSFVEKEIQINGKNGRCLFDTSRELNLANYETYQGFGLPELPFDEIQFSGIPNEFTKPLWYLSAVLCINGIDITAKIDAIEDLHKEVVLGINIISNLDLLKDNGLKILNKCKIVWIDFVEKFFVNTFNK